MHVCVYSKRSFDVETAGIDVVFQIPALHLQNNKLSEIVQNANQIYASRIFRSNEEEKIMRIGKKYFEYLPAI